MDPGWIFNYIEDAANEDNFGVEWRRTGTITSRHEEEDLDQCWNAELAEAIGWEPRFPVKGNDSSAKQSLDTIAQSFFDQESTTSA